jgi:hypothetical protein
LTAAVSGPSKGGGVDIGGPADSVTKNHQNRINKIITEALMEYVHSTKLIHDNALKALLSTSTSTTYQSIIRFGI